MEKSLSIRRFRSLWGIDSGPQLEAWKSWFPDLKEQGYAGIEVDIYGLDDHLRLLRRMCDEIGLEINVLIFSSWPQYSGPRPKGLGPERHLGRYREQLKLASILKPTKVNAQSGADYWSPEQAVEFFRGTLEIDAEFGFTGIVCHETHRNRGLFNPYVSAYILEKVPELRITADFSHWVLVCERILDIGDEDREILDLIIPRVHHIHTRIGTTQSSQCPQPTDSAFADVREFFERTWKRIIDATLANSEGDGVLTFVPEYGPFPYHPIESAVTHGELADSEGKRLQALFEDYVNEKATKRR